MNMLMKCCGMRRWILTLALFAPIFGVIAAPMELRIQGTHLGTATEVTLEGVAVPYKVLDEGTLLITLETVPAGNARLVVMTPGGKVEQSLALPTRVPEAPSLKLTEVMPAIGPESGGASLVILGEGFKRSGRDLKVFFGGIPGRDVGVNSEGRLTVTTPPHAGGWVDLEIRAPDGAVATLKDGFRYLEAPRLTGVNPAEGSFAGGTRVVISGGSFALEGPLQILFGRAPVKEIVTRSANTLEVVIPANVEGPVDLTLINPDGQTAILPKAFTYLPAPTIRTLDWVSH